MPAAGGTSRFVSPQSVALLAKSVGVPQSQLAIALAIARAESGLNTFAVGYNPPTQGCPRGSRDRGLWQINDCYHSNISDACAFDPACNARAMAAISGRGSNWRPWSTFTNGAYLQWLPWARSVVANLGPGFPPSTSLPPYDPINDLVAKLRANENPIQAAGEVVTVIFNRALLIAEGKATR